MANLLSEFKRLRGWLGLVSTVIMLGGARPGTLPPGTNRNTVESKEGKYETA
jgi:hypothetical protein